MYKVKLAHKHPKDGYPFQQYDEKGVKIQGAVIWVNKEEFTLFEVLPKNFENIIKWFIVEKEIEVVPEIMPEPAPEKKVVKKKTTKKRK